MSSIVLSVDVSPSDFECVVCREPMIGNGIKKMYQCCNGEHNLCLECANQIVPKRCPICRAYGEFIPDPRRQRMMDRYLQKCPHPMCSFQTYEWLMQNHLLECTRARMVCPHCHQTIENDEKMGMDNRAAIIRHYFGSSSVCRPPWARKGGWRQLELSLIPNRAFRLGQQRVGVIGSNGTQLLFIRTLHTMHDGTRVCELSGIDFEKDESREVTVRIGTRAFVSIVMVPIWKSSTFSSSSFLSSVTVAVRADDDIFLFPYAVGDCLNVWNIDREEWVPGDIREVDFVEESVLVSFQDGNTPSEWIGIHDHRFSLNRPIFAADEEHSCTSNSSIQTVYSEEDENSGDEEEET